MFIVPYATTAGFIIRIASIWTSILHPTPFKDVLLDMQQIHRRKSIFLIPLGEETN